MAVGADRSCRDRRQEMEAVDGIEEFLEELDRREYEPLLAKVTGRVRFDLVEDGRADRWLLVVAKGHTTVWHRGGPADCAIQADRALFERLCRGEENAMAAVLRGALVCSGDVELLFAVQRIFPGPPRDRQAMSGAEGSR
jgi:putative sterol carrier protein